MATDKTAATAALEACAGFWEGRAPFYVRDPRVEPECRDKLSDPRMADTITIADVTLDARRAGGGVVLLTRENKFGEVKRFRFDLEAWRALARELRVIHVAGYQAGESAPGRVLS